jgi:UDP-N-acetylglucosamine 4,6-dehydratase
MFKNKTLLITGGTGSFGHAVLNRFLETNIGEIRIFSRDEKKQDDMRKQYNSHNTYRLNVEEIKDKLLQLDYINNELSNWKKTGR